MENINLKVLTIDFKDLDTGKDIALQAWNIKREIRNSEYKYLDLMFLENHNSLRVKFSEFGNIEKTVRSWGEVLFEEKETLLLFNFTDLKSDAVDAVDEVFNASLDDVENDTGDIAFRLVE